MNMQETRRLLTFALMLIVPGCGDDGNPATIDATPPPPIDAAAPPAFTLTTTPVNLGERLVDSTGRSLYFFANDIAGTNASACPAALCPAIWIPVDVASPTVGAGLTATDFGHFGNQTTWKGRPLYRFANDTTALPTAGENVAGRWFVARGTYNLFVGFNAAVKPAGGVAGAPFFTNGAGRTVYVFANDRGTGTNPPANTCSASAGCAALWTPWTKPPTVVGPSTVLPTNITAVPTTPGSQPTQFAYKGWPLYFFTAETQPGQIGGASIPSAGAPLWYAVNVDWDGTTLP